MGKDLKYAVYMLAKNPSFAVMAILALALGIGANTAIFSVVNAVLIQRMPFHDPERLVMVWEQSPRTGKANVVNPLNFLEWQQRNRSFARIAALIAWNASLTGSGEPEVVDTMAVSDGFFSILGVKPLLGRWFTPREDTTGNDNVAILSEGLWRRRYAADPHIVGRQIRVNNHQATVVGVMPREFRFPFAKPEIWQPLTIDRERAQNTGRYLSTIARLLPGATVASAQADMNTLMPQLQRERPEFNSKWGITVVGLREQVVGDVRTPLLVLLSAVGLVLLIACANVANLMLMRAAGRVREIAVRTALGAGAVRIARQLLVESTVVAVLGGALGLLIGFWMIRALTAALPDTITYANLKTIRLDATVFLFAAVVSLATGVLFGLAPAFKAVRADVQEALKESGRGIAGGRSFGRNTLVVAEVALSVLLLTGAGLLIRSFAHLANVPPGFDAFHALSMQLATAGRFSNDQKMLDFTTQMLDRVRTVPGVEAAGTSHFLPLGRIIPATGFWRADRARPAHGEESITEVLVVMPGYFASLNIPLMRGRVFTEQDRSSAPLAVIVNETLARQFYPNENPIGKRLSIQWDRKEPYEIVGVVGDVRQAALSKDPKPGVFLSNLQVPTGPLNLVVRTHGNPKQLTIAIQAKIHSLDREVPISNVKTMDQYVTASIAAPRFQTILLGSFAGLALILAAVGIFGVISYSVAQRTQDIAVRRALGAETRDVMRMVLSEGMSLVAVGLLIGLAGAFALTRLLHSLLFGVSPTDVLTFAIVVAVLMAVALAACYLPARRAAMVDPMAALRYE
jgi:putative ABC transport system permease protein